MLLRRCVGVACAVLSHTLLHSNGSIDDFFRSFAFSLSWGSSILSHPPYRGPVVPVVARNIAHGRCWPLGTGCRCPVEQEHDTARLSARFRSPPLLFSRSIAICALCCLIGKKGCDPPLVVLCCKRPAAWLVRCAVGSFGVNSPNGERCRTFNI